jgi:hypothetical protein
LRSKFPFLCKCGAPLLPHSANLLAHSLKINHLPLLPNTKSRSDLDSENGEVGNEFFRNQEGYAARYPLLPAPGNHESHQNYSQYTARFSGVASNLGANSGSGSAHYYSLDVGLVHLVAFSTEVYWSMQGAVQSQLNWLKQDLAKANANRAKVPWIVAFGHKSWYMVSGCPARARAPEKGAADPSHLLFPLLLNHFSLPPSLSLSLSRTQPTALTASATLTGLGLTRFYTTAEWTSILLATCMSTAGWFPRMGHRTSLTWTAYRGTAKIRKFTQTPSTSPL